MVKTYVRPLPMFVRGEGMYLWDIEGRKYLDFTAGIAVNALGHCEPEVSKLIAEQVNLSTVAFLFVSRFPGPNSHAYL
jgi:acetylornithine aminotransferase